MDTYFKLKADDVKGRGERELGCEQIGVGGLGYLPLILLFRISSFENMSLHWPSLPYGMGDGAPYVNMARVAITHLSKPPLVRIP